MPSISRSALVPFSADEMFRLVCDVESYPQFLPWCADASVQEQSDTLQLASVTIAKSVRQSRFETRNELDPGREIRMNLQDGPFRHLQGSWRFTPLDTNACKVELNVQFEFSSRLLARMISPAFTRVCDSLVSAFIKRAHSQLGVGALEHTK